MINALTHIRTLNKGVNNPIKRATPQTIDSAPMIKLQRFESTPPDRYLPPNVNAALPNAARSKRRATPGNLPGNVVYDLNS